MTTTTKILEKTIGFYGDTSVVTPPFIKWRKVEREEAEQHYREGKPLLCNPWGSFTSNRLPNHTQYVDGWAYWGEVEKVKYILDGVVYGHTGEFETGKYADASGVQYMHCKGEDPDFASYCTFYIPVEEA